MKTLLPFCILFSFFACKKELHFDPHKSAKEVEKMLHSYYADVSENGLTAEFDYLDNSKDFFWNPPGYNSTLNYAEVKREVTKNAGLFSSLNYHWDTLQVFPLSNSLVNYTGIVKGEMIDTLGGTTTVKLLESGTAIKRTTKWKILNGQTSIINMESPKTIENEDLFICHIKLASKYMDMKNWTSETHKIIEQHADFLHHLGQNGTLIFAGRTKLDPNDRKLFGIAVLKVPSLELAQKIVSDDPAVINEIQEVSVFPFSLGIKYFQNLEQ